MTRLLPLVLALTSATAAYADVTVTRQRSDAFHEYALECGDLTWLVTDAGNPRTYGNGEVRLREVKLGTEVIVGYGGIGYLLSADDGSGGGWIAGGHGGTGTAMAVTTEPAITTGQTVVAPEFRTTFLVLGYGASGLPIVALHYDLHFSCEVGLTEQVHAVALRSFEFQAEYVAVLTGPGECLTLAGMYEIQGETELGGQPIGCVSGTVYGSAAPGSTLWSEGDGLTMSIETDVGPLPILIRARDSALKSYLQRFDRPDAAPLDTWDVTNLYTIKVL